MTGFEKPEVESELITQNATYLVTTQVDRKGEAFLARTWLCIAEHEDDDKISAIQRGMDSANIHKKEKA